MQHFGYPDFVQLAKKIQLRMVKVPDASQRYGVTRMGFASRVVSQRVVSLSTLCRLSNFLTYALLLVNWLRSTTVVVTAMSSERTWLEYRVLCSSGLLFPSGDLPPSCLAHRTMSAPTPMVFPYLATRDCPTWMQSGNTVTLMHGLRCGFIIAIISPVYLCQRCGKDSVQSYLDNVPERLTVECAACSG